MAVAWAARADASGRWKAKIEATKLTQWQLPASPISHKEFRILPSQTLSFLNTNSEAGGALGRGHAYHNQPESQRFQGERQRDSVLNTERGGAARLLPL